MLSRQCRNCDTKGSRLSDAQIPAEIEVSEALYEKRLGKCMACPLLLYGTTCGYSGYIVYYKAAFKDRTCPDPQERRW